MPHLLPDTSALHAAAHRIRDRAEGVRRHAATVVARAEATRWHSAAAARFRDRATELALALRHAADRLDAAADALDRHASTAHHRWEELQAAVTGGERAAVAVGESVARAGARVLHAVGL